jgi:hypothetical protein
MCLLSCLSSQSVKDEEKLVVFGYGRERLYTRERAKALARKITCELLTQSMLCTAQTVAPRTLPRRLHTPYLGVKRYTQDESCVFVVYHSREPI